MNQDTKRSNLYFILLILAILVMVNYFIPFETVKVFAGNQLPNSNPFFVFLNYINIGLFYFLSIIIGILALALIIRFFQIFFSFLKPEESDISKPEQNDVLSPKKLNKFVSVKLTNQNSTLEIRNLLGNYVEYQKNDVKKSNSNPIQNREEAEMLIKLCKNQIILPYYLATGILISMGIGLISDLSRNLELNTFLGLTLVVLAIGIIMAMTGRKIYTSNLKSWVKSAYTDNPRLITSKGITINDLVRKKLHEKNINKIL